MKESKRCIHFFGPVLILFSLIVFNSCENFLKSKQVKSEIEAAIAYANAPSYTITVESGDNSGVVKSPAGGETRKKVTDTFSVNFEPFADYEFLYWKIVDNATQTEIANGEYLKLESLEDSETKCNLIKAPANGMKLSLVPVVSARPQILSYSPILASGLAVRDTPIQVVFDHDMSENSIYFTNDEIMALMKELGITDENDERILRTNVKSVPKVYGYKKEGEVFYKNISITDNLSGKNIADCFTAPIFETNRILTIPVNNEKLPSNYEQIQVCLDRKIYSTINNNEIEKNILLPGIKKWIYQVGKETDTIDPSIQECQIGIASGVFTGTLEPQTPVNAAVYPGIADIKYISDDNKLDLNLIVKDTGSGPSSNFELCLIRVFDSDYNKISNPSEIIKKVEYQFLGAQDSGFNYEIDIGQLEDGVYALYLNVSDRSGRSVGWPQNNKVCYFSKDKTPPETVKTVKVEKENGNTNTLRFSWKKNSKDFDHIEITDLVNTADTIIADSGATEVIVNYDINKQFSPYKIVVVDRNGNKSKPFIRKVWFDVSHNDFVNVQGAVISQAIADSDIFVDGETFTIPDLLVCTHEVTQSEFETYMNYAYMAPEENSKGPDFPVSTISYLDAITYCNLRSLAEGLEPVYSYNGETDISKWNIDGNQVTLSKDENDKYYWSYYIQYEIQLNSLLECDTTKNGYRLPYESEWEYIAREKNTSNYSYSGSDVAEEVAWITQNEVNAVMQLNPNGLGIYDMSGNVYEWCETNNFSGFYTIRGNIKDSEGCYRRLELEWYACGAGFRVVRTSSMN